MAHRIPTVTAVESNYLVPVEYVRRMQRCADAVCRVVSSTGVLGTGFLIGRQLIITNNHVLPTVESCSYVPPAESTSAKGVVQFFYEDEKKAIEVPLDGKSIFLTSQSPGKQSAKGELLDFTVVALATVPEASDLSRIYLLPLSLFKDVVTPSKNDEAFIVQHPKGEKTQVSWGPTRVITHDNDAVHYNTKAAEGSSGSPVLNKERRLFAIHRLGKCPDPTHTPCNQGVLIKSIVAFLNKMENPQDSQKTGFATVQEWLDARDLPLLETAQLHWREAKSCIEKAQKYFEKDRKEPFSRKKAYKLFSQAYDHLTQALNQYQNPQEASHKIDKQKIEQQRTVVRWQKMVIELKLKIPVFLPHLKDRNHPMLDLLSNPEELIFTLDQWLTWQQEEVKKNPQLESNPAICFLMAFVTEEFFENKMVIENEKGKKIKLSAMWYLSLARSYHDRHDNLFLKRECLKKAFKLDPSIESEKAYHELDRACRVKEDQFKGAFNDVLKRLDSKSGSSRPSCFIFYDKEEETETWIDKVFHPHLQTVGSVPLYDKKKTDTKDMVHFICEGIRDSKYVLILCTPSLVEKEAQAFTTQKPAALPPDIKLVKYAFQMLQKYHDIGASDTNVLRIIQDGESEESIPPTFADGDSLLFNTTLNYYENILRLFGIIKFDDGGGGGEPASPMDVQATVDLTGSEGGGGGNLIEHLISQLNMIHLGADKMEVSAASGNAESNFHLAQCYSFGYKHGSVKYEVNLDKAVAYYEKASSLEDGRAEVRLGQIMMSKGRPEAAFTWFDKAEKKGNLQALRELEKYYTHWKIVREPEKLEQVRAKLAMKRGKVIDKATKEKLIFEYNRKLANEEDLMGMMGLAWCYNSGCGVAKNPEEATLWQGAADRLQAKHAKAPSSVVEGRVSKSDPLSPTTPSSVILQEFIDQSAKPESRFYRPDPTGLPKNPPKPAVSAKVSATNNPSNLVEKPSKPAARAKQQLNEEPAGLQIDIGSLAQNLKASAWAEQQFKELQAKLEAERGARLEVSHSHDASLFQSATELLQELEEQQAKRQADLEKNFFLEISTTHDAKSAKPAMVKQRLKGQEPQHEGNVKRDSHSETPQSHRTGAIKPAAASSIRQNKVEKKSDKQERQKNQNA